jgi:hypothetical protein
MGTKVSSRVVTQHLEEIADFVLDFIETIFSVPDILSSILFTPTIICLTPACEPKGHAPSLTIREYLRRSSFRGIND